jgi:hypothetical protein
MGCFSGTVVEKSSLEGNNTDYVTPVGKDIRLFLLDRAAGHPYIRGLLL